ncbi:TPA: hypothetical protein OBO48_004616 [Escherichia coli]|nr:hypothetical protein [Escherichia coli]EFL4055950.1 hypothetical protein [Escherichia coli]EFN4330292.1 hypothetical protein [Escherichia coli]EGO4295015.1 hypothetical protein [Escherichia coli]EHR8527503.1 hypothetical protein [Escherichia coli]
MNINTIIKNSSAFIAYMTCVGWGSAYFYGWGLSYYHGFSWWYIGVNTDNVARSLLYAISLMISAFIAWFVGMKFFLIIKRSKPPYYLEFLRASFYIFTILLPVVIELFILSNEIVWWMLIIPILLSVLITLFIHFFSRVILLREFFIQVKRYFYPIVMVAFVINFWLFSYLAGYYRSQIKKDFEMINHKGSWYYVLMKNNDGLILSKSYSRGHNQFIFLKTDKFSSYEFSMVKVRL